MVISLGSGGPAGLTCFMADLIWACLLCQDPTNHITPVTVSEIISSLEVPAAVLHCDKKHDLLSYDLIRKSEWKELDLGLNVLRATLIVH
jgi:hypothetical protein